VVCASKTGIRDCRFCRGFPSEWERTRWSSDITIIQTTRDKRLYQELSGLRRQRSLNREQCMLKLYNIDITFPMQRNFIVCVERITSEASTGKNIKTFRWNFLKYWPDALVILTLRWQSCINTVYLPLSVYL